MTDFSVLMSVYKKENPSYMRDCLNSVFNQTLQPTEVVLVEDGPLTQELYDLVSNFEKHHSRLKVVPLEKNGGLGKALNEGLKHCSYDYVARMDTDDQCYPTRFEKQIKFLEEHPDIDVVGSLTTEFTDDENGVKKILSTKYFPETVEENERYSRKRCPVEHPAVIFKKQAVLKAGGYQHCLLFEDYHLWARMFVKGAKFYNIQEPLLYFRMTEDSFNRRGGLKYAMNELKALGMFRKIGFLSNRQYLFTILTRFPVRVMPHYIRKFIYNKFLRRH
jgi:glycosyltransferase involved in cell wall biosynthesis